jgi:hypothetical protein
MSDPRSKAKAPKVKESKAPHQLQAQQKQQAMKMSAPPAQKIMKAAGRGR